MWNLCFMKRSVIPIHPTVWEQLQGQWGKTGPSYQACRALASSCLSSSCSKLCLHHPLAPTVTVLDFLSFSAHDIYLHALYFAELFWFINMFFPSPDPHAWWIPTDARGTDAKCSGTDMTGLDLKSVHCHLLDVRLLLAWFFSSKNSDTLALL